MHKHFLPLILIIFSCVGLFQHAHAQNGENAVGLQLVSGQVFENKNERFGGIFGADLSYITSLESTKEWTQFLNAKKMVWTCYWRNMDGLENAADSIQNFGNVFGFSMGANFEIWKAGRIQIDFAPAFGLSYFTKKSIVKYNEIVGVGSSINDLIAAGLNLDATVSNRVNLISGVTFIHFSNAGFQNPNGGINSWSIKLGFSYRVNSIQQKADSVSANKTFKHPEKSSVELSAGIGRRGVDNSQKGFFRSAWYGGYNYYFNQVIGLKAGFDLVYYRTVFDPAHYAQTFQDMGSSYDHLSTGISIGADIAMNRLVLTYQTGKYLHFNGPFSLKTYWKGGFRYYFTPSFGVNSIVYLNGLNADFINWGIVLRIK